MIVRKTPEQVEKMAAAGEILVRCLRMLASKARPGVSTLDLDEAAERFIRSQDAEPAFKGYRGFPGSICASPNSMVVHGIPEPGRAEAGRHPLDRRRGGQGRLGGRRRDHRPDRLDHPRGAQPARDDQGLAARGQRADAAGNHLGDVSAAIQRRVELDGFSVIRTLVGHGIGRDMHEDPQIPNFGEPGRGPELEEGMVFAIEPMVNAGGPLVRIDDDGWSVYSQDGSLAAHFEFTVAVTAEGPRILTPWHEEG